ncbi:MAG: hypothetical protein ACRC7C_04445, partial [Beijerinckiaceae bacterium]
HIVKMIDGRERHPVHCMYLRRSLVGPWRLTRFLRAEQISFGDFRHHGNALPVKPAVPSGLLLPCLRRCLPDGGRMRGMAKAIHRVRLP